MRNIGLFLTLALVPLIYFSCESEKEKNKKEIHKRLKVYFTANHLDTLAKLDSFILARIDTISQRDTLNYQVIQLGKSRDALIEVADSQVELVKAYRDQAELYAFLGSSTLLKIANRNLEDTKQKTMMMLADADTITGIIKRLGTILQTADSVTAVGYVGVCFYQIRKSDMSVNRDTAWITMNKSFDIVETQEFTRIPYIINWSKYK